jgi:hypothetical protein
LEALIVITLPAVPREVLLFDLDLVFARREDWAAVLFFALVDLALRAVVFRDEVLAEVLAERVGPADRVAFFAFFLGAAVEVRPTDFLD